MVQTHANWTNTMETVHQLGELGNGWRDNFFFLSWLVTIPLVTQACSGDKSLRLGIYRFRFFSGAARLSDVHAHFVPLFGGFGWTLNLFWRRPSSHLSLSDGSDYPTIGQ